MNNSLYEAVKKYKTISIIGICKNAGKTTALNSILRGCRGEGGVVALTSIGRDGEAVDVVTGTEKPGIYIEEGTLVATAAGLLRAADFTKEILETTGVSTPLGEVVLVRALSDGAVELAGPSAVEQLIALSALFRRHGAKRIIIDGAVGRRTLCTRRLAEATVLCTGASCGRDMDRVVEETGYVCRLLGLPRFEDTALLKKADAHTIGGLVLLCGAGVVLKGAEELLRALRKADEGGRKAVYVGGALSDGLLAPLLASGLSGKLDFIVRDASRILLTKRNYDRLAARGWAVWVEQPIRLAAVTVNPFSAYGYHFDKDAFLDRVSRVTAVPVINVEER